MENLTIDIIVKKIDTDEIIAQQTDIMSFNSAYEHLAKLERYVEKIEKDKAMAEDSQAEELEGQGFCTKCGEPIEGDEPGLCARCV